MRSILFKIQVITTYLINSLFCNKTLFMEFPLSIFRCGVCHIVCDAVAQLIGQWPRQDRKIELVSEELNHFGLIAGLFRQIRGHTG